MIQTRSGKLYTGITNNLERRFAEHSGKKSGAKFFHFSEPVQIVFQEEHANRSEASKREIHIKRMTRKQKLDLMPSVKPDLNTL